MIDAPTIQALRSEYFIGRTSPGEILETLIGHLEDPDTHPWWLARAGREELQERAAYLTRELYDGWETLKRKPLLGIPFVVGPHVQDASLPFEEGSASVPGDPVVEFLREAGAVLVGRFRDWGFVEAPVCFALTREPLMRAALGSSQPEALVRQETRGLPDGGQVDGVAGMARHFVYTRHARDAAFLVGLLEGRFALSAAA